MAELPIRVLSSSQLATLAEHGEERTAEVGEKLFEPGDATYPFAAIIEGEIAVRDPAGDEIVRQGPNGFLGELNLLTGQAVFLTAEVTEPLRYIAVDREELRRLLFEDASLSELLLPAFIERREFLQAREGIGIQIVGPADSPPTRELVNFARQQRLPFDWNTEDEVLDVLDAAELPLVRIPGRGELRAPSAGELSRALGIGLELAQSEEVDLLILGGGPGRPRGRGLRRLGGAGDAGRRGDRVGRTGRDVAADRELSGVPGRDQRQRADQPRRIAGAQVRGADGDALPRAVVGARRRSPCGEARGGQRDRGAGGAALDRGRIPAPAGRWLADYEGISVFYAAGPPEAHLCGGQRVGVVGGGNSAAQAAIWLARGGALVTLLHRRADLSETMSNYLITDLDRYGVAVRDRSEIELLHGADGHLDSVTLTDGTEVPISFLFLFLGAAPCTEWLGDCIARDEKGFVLTGAEAGADGLLETSTPGVYAAGDVRAGSIKRCATAVGEGAAVVRFVHERMANPS